MEARDKMEGLLDCFEDISFCCCFVFTLVDLLFDICFVLLAFSAVSFVVVVAAAAAVSVVEEEEEEAFVSDLFLENYFNYLLAYYLIYSADITYSNFNSFYHCLLIKRFKMG
jgi:hypothetical protein